MKNINQNHIKVMQKKLLGFIFLISINCFSQEYFEGELNYNIEYESIMRVFQLTFLKKNLEFRSLHMLKKISMQ